MLLALPLWLGWPCAAPPPPLLGVLRPISFEVGVICDFICVGFVFSWQHSPWAWRVIVRTFHLLVRHTGVLQFTGSVTFPVTYGLLKVSLSVVSGRWWGVPPA